MKDKVSIKENVRWIQNTFLHGDYNVNEVVRKFWEHINPDQFAQSITRRYHELISDGEIILSEAGERKYREQSRWSKKYPKNLQHSA